MLTDLQRIEHMIETADLLLQFAANLTEAEYAASLEKQYAMKFAFVMLGEDAARISEEIQNKYPDIPWREIKGLRNIVAHAYNKTDGEIIWDTVSRDIEPLRQQLLQIKSDLQSSAPSCDPEKPSAV